jgi:hypothetical protein
MAGESRRNDREVGRNARGVRIQKRGTERKEDEQAEIEEKQGRVN